MAVRCVSDNALLVCRWSAAADAKTFVIGDSKGEARGGIWFFHMFQRHRDDGVGDRWRMVYGCIFIKWCILYRWSFIYPDIAFVRSLHQQAQAFVQERIDKLGEETDEKNVDGFAGAFRLCAYVPDSEETSASCQNWGDDAHAGDGGAC